MRLHWGHWISALSLVVLTEVGLVWLASGVFHSVRPADQAPVSRVNLRLSGSIAGSKAAGIRPGKQAVSTHKTVPAMSPKVKPEPKAALEPKAAPEPKVESRQRQQKKPRPVKPHPGVKPMVPSAAASASLPNAPSRAPASKEPETRRAGPPPGKPVDSAREVGAASFNSRDVIEKPALSNPAVMPARAIQPGGPIVAQGGAASAPDPGIQKKYQSRLVARLVKHKRYPEKARQRGITGTVAVQFEITAAGRLVSRRIAASSGYGVLDRAALAMLDRAGPLPAIPEGYGPPPYRFTIPLTYELQ